MVGATEATLIAKFAEVQDRLEMLGYSICLTSVLFQVYRTNESMDKCVALNTVDELMAFCIGAEAGTLQG